MLDFDRMSREEKILFLFCPAGTEVQLGEEAQLVCLQDNDFVFSAPDPFETVTIPPVGQWFAVSYRVFKAEMGFRDAYPYRVAVMPGKTYHLGFFGEVSLRVVHIQGLQRFMRKQERMTAQEALLALRESALQTVQQAIRDVVFEAEPDYEKLTSKRREIEQKIEEGLFWFAYPYGLCLRSGTLEIKGFSRPVL